MRKATRTQWIKFSIVTLLYLAFLVWVKSWLGLIVLPFIFDIYISKKIPWGFWKKSENPAVRSIMSWVDAIVFALVAVYFVNIYVFQNYQIPSSSLEKSLFTRSVRSWRLKYFSSSILVHSGPRSRWWRSTRFRNSSSQMREVATQYS